MDASPSRLSRTAMVCAGPIRSRWSFRRKIRPPLDAAQSEFNGLTAQYESAEELPDDVDARFGELEAEIERLEAKRRPTTPTTSRACGAFVILNHDGSVADRARLHPGRGREAGAGNAERERRRRRPVTPPVTTEEPARTMSRVVRRLDAEDENDDHKPLSDILIRDLTAHRTLGLRLALERAAGSRRRCRHPRARGANLLSRRGRPRSRYPPGQYGAGLACGRYRGHQGGEGVGGSPRPLGGADAARRGRPVGFCRGA